MKKWQIHQPSEEAAKQIRSSSDLSMLCAQVLAARGMHNVQEAAAFLQCDGLADPFLTADMDGSRGMHQHGSGRRQPHLHLRRL